MRRRAGASRGSGGEVKKGPEALLAGTIHGEIRRVDRRRIISSMISKRFGSDRFGALEIEIEIERRGGSSYGGRGRGGSGLGWLVLRLLLVVVMVGRSGGEKGGDAAGAGAVRLEMGSRSRRGGGGGNGVEGAEGGRRGVVGGRRGVEGEERGGGVGGRDEHAELVLEAEGTDGTGVSGALEGMLATLHAFVLRRISISISSSSSVRSSAFGFSCHY